MIQKAKDEMTIDLGISLFIVIVLATLKLAGICTISWFLVCLPVLAQIALGILLALLIVFVQFFRAL